MNIFQKAITPDMPRVLEGEQIYVYVPQATSTNAGIAGYTSRDFNVNNSIVSLKWPIESKIQGPLNTASLVKVDSSEFENTNENIITEYEGNAIMSQTGIKLVRTERDAYSRPDFVMLDSDYFPRELIDKDGQKFYKYTTSAVHYIVQNLTEAQKVQARENINAGSLHAVEIANSKADNAVATAISAKDLALDALDTASTADETANEALRYVKEEVGTQITVGEDFVRTLLFTSDPQEQINNKADAEYVNTELAKKADTEYINTELAKKADTKYVDAELDKRAGINYVNAELSKKANTEYVNTELAKKADTDYVNTELTKKSDTTYVDQKIADLVGSAPDALNTLEELSAALNNNKDIVKTINDAIALKADKATLETDYLPLSAGSSKTLTGVLHTKYGNSVWSTTDGINLAPDAYIVGNNAGEVGIKSSSIIVFRIADANDLAITENLIRPGANNTQNLGNTDYKWKEIHGTIIYQNGKQVANAEDVVTKNTPQKITGAKYFTGQVGNTQTEAGVYLGLDTNAEAPNANMAITSANSAAYIDMGKPNHDYDFRLIKWDSSAGNTAQMVYSAEDGGAAATVTIPRESGTIALTGGITNGYFKASTLVSSGDVQAAYLQASAAGHETGTYDKIATLSSTGYIRYRTKAEVKSDIGVPTDYIKSATVSNGSIILTKQDDTTVSFAGSGITLNQWNVYESSNKLIFSLK